MQPFQGPVPFKAPPAGLGGPTPPQSNAGNAVNAVGLIHGAIKGLQRALPSLPHGSSQYSAVLKCLVDLNKEFPAEEENPALTHQSMLGMIRANQANSPLAALMRMQQGGGGDQQSPVPPTPQGGPAPPGGDEQAA